MPNENGRNSISEESIDLARVFKLLRKYRLIIFLVVLLTAIISGLISFYLPPTYEARAIIMVTQAPESSQPIINTYVGQVKSEILIQRVINRLNLASKEHPETFNIKAFLLQLQYKTNEQKFTAWSLSRKVNARAIKDSNLIEITVYNNDPELAAQIANTLSQEFILLMKEKQKEMIQQSIDFMRSQIISMQQQMLSATEASEKKLFEDTLALLTDRTRITRSIDMGNIGMVVTSSALDPVSPVKPNKIMIISIATLLVFMVSIVLAVAKESFNNKINTPEDIAQHLKLPVIGVIFNARSVPKLE